MIKNVLVANRGEIARRVFRTCRDMGIGCVAVFSDADAGAPHVAEADVAVRLPGDVASQTYLDGARIVAAALAAGADAVHPGYGFLSENAGFAERVRDAGLVWIGPDPAAIAAMGSKIDAKAMMVAAGVPVLERLTPDELTAADLPVLVKASAGGGGRGMRVIRSLDTVDDEIAAARSEAGSAFGDDTVFCERYLPTGHHIEVQILADTHGTVLAVGERECSIQRRHQKVVEESPAPLVERVPGMRERLYETAVEAGRAVGYTGAGTVEFLADDDGRFYFLEMNTRLQVEHPVTEATTGWDLVRQQIRIANGAALPAEPAVHSGAAIEVRLYAEDPANDWQPQSGPVHRFHLPEVTAEFTNPPQHGVRLDSGIEAGSVIGVHYDPMLAKVIAWAPDRAEAAARLAGVLRRGTLHGPRTNRDLLVRVLTHPAFTAGETDTSFLDTHGIDALAAPLLDDESERLHAIAATLAAAAANRTGHALPGGWRNVTAHPQRKTFTGDHGEHEIAYRPGRTGVTLEHDDVRVLSTAPDTVVLECAGLRREFTVATYGDESYVDSALGSVVLRRKPRYTDPTAEPAPGSLLAPMPGTVSRVAVAEGDPVTAGTPLLWLEAMKMEHRITAPVDGLVGTLGVRQGQQVQTGTVLAVITEPDGERRDTP